MDEQEGGVVVTLATRRQRVEHLAALLDGDLDEADVRPEVRRLAHAATLVRTEVAPAPLEAAARDRIRDRVLAEIHLGAAEADTAPAPRARTRRSPRVAIAGGLASVLVAGGAVTVAAQEALPGDALYSIKRATESVRMAVAGDLTEVGRLELALAEQRLDEVLAANARGTVAPSHLVDALDDMDARSWRGVEALALVSEREDRADVLIEAVRFTEEQAGRLTAGYADLPITVRPHAEASLTALREMRLQVLDPLLVDCADCIELGILPAGSVTTPPPVTSGDLPPAPVEAPEQPGGDGGSTGDGSTAPPATDAPSNGTGGGPAPAPSGPTEGATPRTPDLPVGSDTPRRLVPPLPGPLDDVGEAVDETVGDTVDGVGRVIDGVGGTVGDVVEDPGGTVGDVIEDPGGTVGDVVDGVTDGLGDTVGSVTDGIIGGGRPRG